MLHRVASSGMETSNTQPNMLLANMARNARLALDMSQEDVALAMDRSRHWVTQLERGTWYKNGETFTLYGDNALRLALTLDLDPVEVLRAGQVELERWPDLSKVRSNSDSVKSIDISSLSPQQQNIIERLVDEFKYPTSGNDKPEPEPRSHRRASKRYRFPQP